MTEWNASGPVRTSLNCNQQGLPRRRKKGERGRRVSLRSEGETATEAGNKIKKGWLHNNSSSCNNIYWSNRFSHNNNSRISECIANRDNYTRRSISVASRPPFKVTVPLG